MKAPNPNCQYCGGTGELEVKDAENIPCSCVLPEDDNDSGGGGNMGIRPWKPKPNKGGSGGSQVPVPSPIKSQELKTETLKP